MNLATPADRSTDTRGGLPRLAYFVLGSVVLHTLLVALWRGEPPAGAVGRGTFQITLLEKHGDAPGNAGDKASQEEKTEFQQSVENGEASGEPGKPPAATELASLQPLASAAPVSRPATQSRAPSRKPARQIPEAAKVQRIKTHAVMLQAHSGATSGSASHGRDPLSSAARYHRVRAALHQALLPRFDYPSLARRRGWQGRVRVGLHVEADGDLTRIRLVESSGHVMLDKAAIKNVTELRNVPAVTQWLDGRDMDVILPVRYQLRNP